jgi:hypothetical protein
MGNRGGALHNDQREIVRQCMGRRWITCLLQFKGIRRSVMTPGRYTELFFLDEAVALAAGHRPCAECRRARFNDFKNAWKRSMDAGNGKPLLAPEMDAELHRARIDSQGKKVTYEAPLSNLPGGCFVQMDRSTYLVWGEALLLWSPQGYVARDPMPARVTVTVLTPEPIVHCLGRGYQPEIHHSGLAL